MENVATEEFISRTEALKDFESCNAENPNWTPQRVKTLLLRQPAADVAEVVHGGWEETGCDTIICSRCGFEYDLICMAIEDYAYCPNCGSKMDGGTDNVSD